MSEVGYLRYIFEKYSMSKDLKQTINKFLNLHSYEELVDFAKEIGIENIKEIPVDQLKEKIAYELIEKYFLEEKNQYKKDKNFVDIFNKLIHKS